jgi:tRNA dimethylallyltransferase
LIDICDPGETVGAVAYKKLAEAKIMQIRKRKHLPVLVGGSGLYVDSVLFDYQFPRDVGLNYREVLENLSDDALRQELHTRVGKDSWPLDLANRRRVIRAIETAGQARSKRKNVIPNTLVLGITTSKEVAQRRITSRINKMLQKGFIDEVANIGAKFGWDSSALNVIGYSEFKYVCLEQKTIAQCTEDCIRSSMALYKKQVTWFKRNSEIQWLDGEHMADASIRADELVGAFLATQEDT